MPTIQVVVSVEEGEAIKVAARAEGRTVSAWAWRVLMRAALPEVEGDPCRPVLARLIETAKRGYRPEPPQTPAVPPSGGSNVHPPPAATMEDRQTPRRHAVPSLAALLEVARARRRRWQW